MKIWFESNDGRIDENVDLPEAPRSGDQIRFGMLVYMVERRVFDVTDRGFPELRIYLTTL